MDIQTITSKKQLIQNLNKVEEYLTGGSDESYSAMSKYIARGRVFVTYIVDGKYHFAPSRFVGYKNNTLTKHENNNEKDGTITSPAISKILGSKNQFYSELEDAYLTYCEWLGATPTNHKRTFWLLNQDILDELTSEPFQEGGYKMRVHRIRERNRKVVDLAKDSFKKAHGGKLFCEICGFDFGETYGKLGEDFIEAHHKVELSASEGEHEIKPSDLMIVCSNCHSILHARNVSIEELKKVLKKKK